MTDPFEEEARNILAANDWRVTIAGLANEFRRVDQRAREEERAKIAAEADARAAYGCDYEVKP